MTLSVEDRAVMVLTEAWRRLPPVKRAVAIDAITLRDLGAKHGSWAPDTRTLTLSTRLFTGPADYLPMFDMDGNSPPMREPFCSRALHTVIHEASHAIGTATGLDDSSEWCALSGFVQADDNPQGTGRYFENRPGWPQTFSDWRYRLGTWWAREYSSKSPAEDFADALTHVCLGWLDFAVQDHPYRASGLAKLAFLRRHLWNEKGSAAIAAARQRWQEKFAGVYV